MVPRIHHWAGQDRRLGLAQTEYSGRYGQTHPTRQTVATHRPHFAETPASAWQPANPIPVGPSRPVRSRAVAVQSRLGLDAPAPATTEREPPAAASAQRASHLRPAGPPASV